MGTQNFSLEALNGSIAQYQAQLEQHERDAAACRGAIQALVHLRDQSYPPVVVTVEDPDTDQQ